MKPLEAVARALWQVSDRSETYESEADFWQEKARAAITALRDAGVTEGMWANWITADECALTDGSPCLMRYWRKANV